MALPPDSMPVLRRGRALKRWRWVGFFCREAMICVGQARVGPLRQSFWAVWDRERALLRERTVILGRSGISLATGRAQVRGRGLALVLTLQEKSGVETVCPSGDGRGYVWTCKQGAVAAQATLALAGAPARTLTGLAVIDDTAGYHDRRTEWWWAAGVGATHEGAPVAWNLVSGVNDPPHNSERTVWIDSVAHELGPARFAADLGTIEIAPDGGHEGATLRFAAEAERRRSEQLLVLASDYRQPFGTFSGSLPVAGELVDGLGVTEHHRALW